MNYYFDMDGTICNSKQKITAEMKNCLTNLKSPLIIVSGASREQMEWQLDGLECTILAQSGNDSPLWQNKLTKREIWQIRNHIFNFGNPNDEEKFENRGCQVAYSFTGHDAPQKEKNEFDPQQVFRRIKLKMFPLYSKTLVVKIGGTTCLDYTKKSGTKGKNIARWIKENGLDKKDCVYYGDALFKGGNDESVIGIIKTIAVKNPQDLCKKLQGK